MKLRNRIAQGGPLLLFVSIGVFTLIHAAPGGPTAVFLSNPGVRPEDIERLYAIVDRMADIVRRRAWDEADRVDVELHVAIARLSRSPSLMDALGRCHLLDIIRRRLLASERHRDFEELEVNHRKLVDAIASHDPDRAAQVMHAHLSRHGR